MLNGMTPEIDQLTQEISELKAKLAQLQSTVVPESVENFEFANGITLLSLFGDRAELLVVHNMGQSCSYCTLWADGLNGLISHFENRAAFVLVSPDAPESQKELADTRGWKFQMVCDASKEFSSAMGFWNENDGCGPGMSAFRREGDRIFRTGKTDFGPGDDFCAVWPAFDLLGGEKTWEPKNKY